MFGNAQVWWLSAALLFLANLKTEAQESMYKYELYIRAPQAKVWEALTNPAQVSKYYLAPAVDYQMKVGGKITFGSAKKTVIQGEVTRFEPEHFIFAHTFTFPGTIKKPAQSTVTYTLEGAGATITHLTLEHSGFKRDSSEYADIASGWPTILSSLKTYLETGTPIKWN